MNIKTTEKLVPGGLGGPLTRSRIDTVPDVSDIPIGSVETSEAPRDWQNDEPNPPKVPIAVPVDKAGK